MVCFCLLSLGLVNLAEVFGRVFSATKLRLAVVSDLIGFDRNLLGFVQAVLF